jgi:D-beta-D-heptose 7-phosphate kinase/D-beta-D-heptose 1-phosphate adenosyltransferase
MKSRDVLSSFPGKKILVVGDVMLDEYIWGSVRRISPEAPVPVVEVQRRTFVPGGAANTASNVQGLGGQAVLVSVLGRDDAGAQTCDILRSRGVDVDGLLIDDHRPTTTKARVIAHNQQVVRVDQEQRTPASPDLEEALLARFERLLPAVDGCALSDYAKGVASIRVARALIQMARRAGKPVVVDPKGTDYTKYRGATVVKPNLHEAGQALNCELGDADSIRQGGGRLVELLDGSAVLITRGPQGMSLFVGGREPLHIPAEAREVFDVTGAGDTVAGTLAMALAAGAPLDLAARLASCAAGVVVGKVGTAAIQLTELAQAQRALDPLPAGLPAGSQGCDRQESDGRRVREAACLRERR